MDKNCNNCTFRERSYSEYPCDKCRSGSNWTPSGNLIDFAIEELEKIKAEVHDIRLEIDCDMHTGDKVIQLIDIRISELKGENNGRT